MLEQYLQHYELIQDVIQSVYPGTKIRVLTRSKSQFYDMSEGKEIEVGLLKMTDLDKEILQEICTILKPFDIITQVISNIFMLEMKYYVNNYYYKFHTGFTAG